MSFDGFPDQALEFYEGLLADNTKAYWSDHKSLYDDAVKAPLVARPPGRTGGSRAGLGWATVPGPPPSPRALPAQCDPFRAHSRAARGGGRAVSRRHPTGAW